MRLLLLFSLFLLPFLSIAQDHSTNLEKYWEYRDRLVNDLMIVGDGQGYSIPPSHIDTINNRIKWADATIWHGWYMGILATEYYMLTHPGRFPDFAPSASVTAESTLEELHYAVKALIRLDENAELSFFSAGCTTTTPTRNGFFMRDDVADSFYTNFPPLTSSPSDYNSINEFDNEMSQDQVYHLLHGLALIKRFVPDSVSFAGFNVRQEAIDEAALIVEWVKNDGWVIKNPICFDGGVPKSVARGPDAFGYSHGTNLAVKYITDDAVDFSSDVDALYTLAWGTLNSPLNPVYLNVDNLHMVMALAATGKGWGNETLTDMMNLAASNKWYAYTLMHCALHDTNAMPGFSGHQATMNLHTEEMLNEAPFGGPFSPYPDTNSHGWSANNRFIRGVEQHYSGGANWNAGSHYTGVDYMLLHNLYYLVTPQKWPGFVGLTDQVERDFWVKMYPVPTRSEINLSWAPTPEKIQLKIVDNLGRTVKEALILPTASSQTQLNIQELPPGHYHLLFSTKTQEIVRPLIKL